jgi:hypothetical protein
MTWNFFFACAALAVPAFGQTGAQEGGTPITGQVNLSSLATGVMEQTKAARHGIAANDRDAALAHVTEALGMIHQIQSAAAANNMESQGRLVVPITGELETESVYGPVKRGDEGKLIARRMKRGTNVRDVTGTVTRSMLDVNAAESNLKTAQAALVSENFTTADAALAAAQQNVVTETANENLPLLRAKQNLTLARTRVLEGKYKDARMPLKSAAQALADYEKLSAGPHASEAGDMRLAISAYADRVGRDHSDALDRIQDWSSKVDSWQPQH